MPLTVQRFFISLEHAQDEDRLHAVLQDGTSLLLVLNYDRQDGWYLTFDERSILPIALMDIARHTAALVLRRDQTYVYRKTRLSTWQLDSLARKICSTSHVLGVATGEDGPYIEVGTRLSAYIGTDPQFDVPKEFQRRWRASTPLVSLQGHPVVPERTMQEQQ